MRRTALSLVVAAGALLAAPVAPVHASVEVMVVGKDEEVLKRPREVAAKVRRVEVRRRRCAVGGRTPLAALVATGLPLTLTDEGACGRSARDAGGLFVKAVSGQRNRGDDGWFYKVGRKAGTTGGGSPEGPFGDGRRLRDGQRVTWFYCDADAQGECQRTLELRPDARQVGAGGTLRVTVTAYDNQGRGVPAAGATVALGEATATAGPDGVVALTVPAGVEGTRSLRATGDGVIEAYPIEIAIR